MSPIENPLSGPHSRGVDVPAPRAPAPIRVILVDDHALYREGLRVTLERSGGVKVVAEAGDAREAALLVASTPFDIAIVDVALPGVSGISIAQEIRRLAPDSHVLMLSMMEDPVRIAEALRADAGGYALKSQPTSEILEAIHAVLGGLRYLAPRISRDRVDALLSGADEGPLGPLSRREREVFDLLVRGFNNEAVAAQLFIAPRTVETHRQRIMTKLGVHSIVDLVRLAARHDLLGE